jgi:hypothetical protein
VAFRASNQHGNTDARCLLSAKRHNAGSRRRKPPIMAPIVAPDCGGIFEKRIPQGSFTTFITLGCNEMTFSINE